MAVAVTTITNISNQVIPILVNDVASTGASDASDLPAATSEQIQMQPGSQITLETARVDLAQLDQLRRKRLLSYS